jgi:DNA-binding NarL/FixJ family response regulator
MQANNHTDTPLNQIRILVVDDHRVMREALRALFENEIDIDVVGEAETGRQAVQMAKQLSPTLVIMDITMPTLNGLEATRQIMRDIPNAKVLMLSAHGDLPFIQQAREAGAAGYLLKDSSMVELLEAVRSTKRGNFFLSHAIPNHIRQECLSFCQKGAKMSKRPGSLSSREIEVLQLIAEGAPNKQIADDLSISVKTTEKHRHNLMDKLHIHCIAGLTRYAIANGMSRAE